MKITHYCGGRIIGDFGTANAIRGWCQALGRAGADVRLLFNERADAGMRPDDIVCVAVPHVGRQRFRVPLRLSEALEGADVLVLHGGWVIGNNVAATVAARRKIPYIVTPHGAYHPRVLRRSPRVKMAWATLSERRYLQRALAVHLFFEDERTGLSELGVHPRTIVAPNGFTPVQGVRWSGDQSRHVLWFGRFDAEGKGLDLLLGALRRLPDGERPFLRLQGPDWRNGKQVVLHLVQELGLENWVSVGDAVYGTEKWDLLASSAGFAYPSRWDAAPMAVLEATSAGVPVLVTPYPLGRVLADKGAAILTEPTVDAVAEGLRALLSPAGRDAGRRGAEVVRELFSWDVSARQWLEQASALLSSS